VLEVHALQLFAHAEATTALAAKKYPVAGELAVQVFAEVQAVQLGHATATLLTIK